MDGLALGFLLMALQASCGICVLLERNRVNFGERRNCGEERCGEYKS